MTNDKYGLSVIVFILNVCHYKKYYFNISSQMFDVQPLNFEFTESLIIRFGHTCFNKTQMGIFHFMQKLNSIIFFLLYIFKNYKSMVDNTVSIFHNKYFQDSHQLYIAYQDAHDKTMPLTER